MRVLFLVLMCISLSACGLVHRGANVARAIYTENTNSSSDTLMALDESPAVPVVTVDGVLPVDDEIPAAPAATDPNTADTTLNAVEPAAAPPQEEDFALYLPNGEIFNPLCLLNNIGSLETPIHPTADCGRDNIHPLTEELQLSNDKKTIFLQYTVDLPPNNEANQGKDVTDVEPHAGNEGAAQDSTALETPATSAAPATEKKEVIPLPPQSGINQISYTNVGTVKGFFAIKITNILYTGEIINSLGLYDFSIDSEDKDTLERKKNYAEGDRCNSSLDSYTIDSTGELRYSVNHTPKSLFLLPYIKNEIQLLEMENKFDALPVCPTCCLGKYEYIDELPTTFIFDSEYITKAKENIARIHKEQAEKELRDKEKGIKRKKDEKVKISPLECVDERFIAIYDKGITSLTPAELETLHKAVLIKCYSAKK